MSTHASPAAASAVATATAPTSTRRDVRHVVLPIGGAMAAGGALQVVVGPLLSSGEESVHVYTQTP